MDGFAAGDVWLGWAALLPQGHRRAVGAAAADRAGTTAAGYRPGRDEPVVQCAGHCPDRWAAAGLPDRPRLPTPDRPHRRPDLRPDHPGLALRQIPFQRSLFGAAAAGGGLLFAQNEPSRRVGEPGFRKHRLRVSAPPRLDLALVCFGRSLPRLECRHPLRRTPLPTPLRSPLPLLSLPKIQSTPLPPPHL